MAEKHCVRLFEDLIKFIKKNCKAIFRKYCCNKASEVEDDLLIIDGQQRITTLSLLILAAFNAVANGDMQPGNEDIEEVRKTISMP